MKFFATFPKDINALAVVADESFDAIADTSSEFKVTYFSGAWIVITVSSLSRVNKGSAQRESR